MRIFKMFFVFAAAIAFAACSDDNLGTSTVEEGQPVSVKLSIAAPLADNITVMSRATSEQEAKVDKVLLLFYKASQPNEVPVTTELTLSSLTPKHNDGGYYVYTTDINVDGLYSGNWYLYAIANYDKKFCGTIDVEELKKMTKSQMDDYCTTGGTDLDFVEQAVLMTGKYKGDDNGATGTLTLKAGENNLTSTPAVMLRRLITQNTFTFTTTASGATFTATSYEVHNVSNSSTLMERSGWEGANSSNPGTLTYKGNSFFNKTNVSISNNTFNFYMQENVQPCSVENMTYKLREERVSDTDRTFKNAPEKSTYVVVKGRYEGPVSSTDNTKVSADVTYTIHLGDFSSANNNAYNNFTVRRNCKYTYNVKVNGVNSIIVEAKQENLDGGYQHGAEGDVVVVNTTNSVRVDAHYEQVLLKLPASVLGISDYSVKLQTPYDNSIYTQNTISSSKDCDWIKFGKPASTSTFQAYKNFFENGKLTKLLSIKDLLDDFAKNSSKQSTDYYIVQGNYVYVAAYVDEYYYDNQKLSDFVNADDREMILATTVHKSSDGQSIYTEEPIFSIQQRAIQCPFNLSLSNPFGVEIVEETTTSNSSGYSNSNITGADALNGYANYSGNFSSKSLNWSDYVDESVNGYIDGKLSTNIAKSTDEFYFCLSRNRDLNGNGVIDKEELRWYLPSHDQCVYLWLGMDALSTEANIFQKAKGYVYLTSTKTDRIWFAEEGSAFNENASYSRTLKIRAVRSLGSYNGTPSAISSFDSNTNIITISGLSENCIRTAEMSGEYPEHYRGDTSDRVPQAFKVATSYLTTTTTNWWGNSTTTENEYSFSEVSKNSLAASYKESNDAGEWRIPNEKELALMLIHKGSDLKNMTAARSKYDEWNGNRVNVYYVQTTTQGTPFITTGMGTTTGFKIRPVRDAEPASSISYDSSYSNSGTAFGVK